MGRTTLSLVERRQVYTDRKSHLFHVNTPCVEMQAMQRNPAASV